MANAAHAKILLVDDNPRVRSFVRPALEDAGFHCIEAEDGWTALDLVEAESPDLVVLDILLGDEDMSGLDVCKRIRERGVKTPVVFLTIKDRADDARYMRRAFQLGGDDYVSKREELRRLEERMGLAPTEFLERKSDIEELLARITARLPIVEVPQELDDHLRVDLGKQLVQVRKGSQWRQVHLTATEFALLTQLVKSGGRPVGKNQLMEGANVDGEASLQNHMWRLRQKIEPDPEKPRYLLTYHRIGYRFGYSE